MKKAVKIAGIFCIAVVMFFFGALGFYHLFLKNRSNIELSQFGYVAKIKQRCTEIPVQRCFYAKASVYGRDYIQNNQTAAKPCSRSAMISSICSVPMERRTVDWEMPEAVSSSSVS